MSGHSGPRGHKRNSPVVLINYIVDSVNILRDKLNLSKKNYVICYKSGKD